MVTTTAPTTRAHAHAPQSPTALATAIGFLRTGASYLSVWMLPIRLTVAVIIFMYGAIAADTLHGAFFLCLVSASIPVWDKQLTARWYKVVTAVGLLIMDVHSAWKAFLNNLWHDADLRLRSSNITAAQKRAMMPSTTAGAVPGGDGGGNSPANVATASAFPTMPTAADGDDSSDSSDSSDSDDDSNGGTTATDPSASATATVDANDDDNNKNTPPPPLRRRTRAMTTAGVSDNNASTPQ